MEELQDLYQEIILDHNKRPRNFRKMEGHTHHAEGDNPLCGDLVTVYAHVEDGVIVDVSFDGQGCAISKASASLMTLKLKGKKLEEARGIMEEVKRMFTASPDTEPDLDEMGDLAAISGVRRFPARVKCATLAWHALEAALQGEQKTTTE